MGNKYPILKPDEIISVLSKRRFVFKSQRGSHAKYTDGRHTVIIPIHDTVARGTLKAILFQAGMDLDDFLELL